MKTVIYLDTLLLVNFLIGYLLLRAAGLLAGQSPAWGRNLLGGAVAALSTLVLLAPQFPFPLQVLYQAFSALVIVRSAFAWQGLRPFFRQAALYFFLNMMLAGAVVWHCSRGGAGLWQTNNLSVYAALSPGLLALCVAGVYLAARAFLLLFGRPASRPLYRLGFQVGQNRVQGLAALYDTGFGVKDPYTGKPALLVALPALEGQLSPALQQALKGYFAQKGPPPAGAGIRLLECRTAFGAGLLPAVTARGLWLEGRGKKGRAAEATLIFSREKLSDGGFQAVFGGELFPAL